MQNDGKLVVFSNRQDALSFNYFVRHYTADALDINQYPNFWKKFDTFTTMLMDDNMVLAIFLTEFEAMTIVHTMDEKNRTMYGGFLHLNEIRYKLSRLHV